MMLFGEDEARKIAFVVRCFRPEWEHPGVMKQMQVLALEGLHLTVAAKAAIRAAQDQQAQTPKAITWGKYRIDPQPVTGPQDPGQRRCVECTRRQDTHTMTKTEHGWTCQQCTGDNQ